MKKRGNIIELVKAVKPLLLLALLAGLLSGCAGKTAAPTATVFFPPPPDNPHIQYLTGITDSTDIEGKPSKFSFVVTGNEQAQVIRKIGKGFGITAHDGKLYVAATGSGQVFVIDFARKKFEYLKGNKAAGALKKPVNIAIDREGYLYVVDTGRKEIVVFDREGNYVKAFGKGLEDTNIVALGVYEDELFACDNKAQLIRVLDRKTGEEIRSFGGGNDPDSALVLPTNLYIDGAGFIYVTNVGTGSIMKFDRDGHLLLKFGKIGRTFREFARPRSVAVDDAGRIYIVDAGHQNVQIFDKLGRTLTFFGNPDKTLPAGTLNLPAGIAVTKDNLDYFQKMAAPGFKLESMIFVLNQYGTPSLSVYGLGEMEGRNYKEPETRPVRNKKKETTAKPEETAESK